MAALVLVGAFSLAAARWKYSPAGRDQPRRFPERVEETSLAQPVREPAREGARGTGCS